MKIEFNEVYQSFKKLNDAEKIQAIVDYIKNNVSALNELNKSIGNDVNGEDINNIMNVQFNNKLDAIFMLLSLMTEQVEMFSEKVSLEFYE